MTFFKYLILKQKKDTTVLNWLFSSFLICLMCIAICFSLVVIVKWTQKKKMKNNIGLIFVVEAILIIDN